MTAPEKKERPIADYYSLPADVLWGSFVTKRMRDKRTPKDVCGEARITTDCESQLHPIPNFAPRGRRGCSCSLFGEESRNLVSLRVSIGQERMSLWSLLGIQRKEQCYFKKKRRHTVQCGPLWEYKKATYRLVSFSGWTLNFGPFPRRSYAGAILGIWL